MSLQRERASPMPQQGGLPLYGDQGYGSSSSFSSSSGAYGSSRVQDHEFESKLVEKTSQEIDNEMIRESNQAVSNAKQELQTIAYAAHFCPGQTLRASP
jgi:hypothetical protein